MIRSDRLQGLDREIAHQRDLVLDLDCSVDALRAAVARRVEDRDRAADHLAQLIGLMRAKNSLSSRGELDAGQVNGVREGHPQSDFDQ